MNSSDPIKAVLLDVGNVLLKINWHNSLKLIDIPKEDAEVFLKIGESPLFHKYEAGLVSCEEFRLELCQKLNTNFSPEKFNHIWCACFDGDIEGVPELVKQVSKKVPLFTLSNTNEAHYQHFKGMPVFAHFEELLTSHKFKCRKPDPLIYQKAIARLNLKPEEILFVDDLEENLEAAKKLGIRSEHCYQSAPRLKTIFRVCGLL